MKDIKVMAEAPAQVGRTVEPSLQGNFPDVPSNFHEFGGNKVVQRADTYESRMDKIAAALGGKAPIKG